MSHLCPGRPKRTPLSLSAFRFGTPFDGNLGDDRASKTPRIRIPDGQNLLSVVSPRLSDLAYKNINEILQLEKLILDLSQIEKTLFKLFVGRIDVQLQLTKIQYLTEQEDLNNILQDCTIQVKRIKLLNNQNQSESDILLINFIEKRSLLMIVPLAMSRQLLSSQLMLAYTFTRRQEMLGDRGFFFRYIKYRLSTCARTVQPRHGEQFRRMNR